MSHLVRVFCQDCNGESADPSKPPCAWCMCQGHEDIDRLPDGSVPPHRVEWVDRELPPLSLNPLRLTADVSAI